MEIHRRLAEHLETILGTPFRTNETRTWHIKAGLQIITVHLDVPTSRDVHLWIFDPRNAGDDCARSFAMRTDEQMAEAMMEVARLAGSRMFPDRSPSDGVV